MPFHNALLQIMYPTFALCEVQLGRGRSASSKSGHAPGCFSISATLPSLMESPMDGTWMVTSSCATAVVRRKRAQEPVSSDHRGAGGGFCRLHREVDPSQTLTAKETHAVFGSRQCAGSGACMGRSRAHLACAA